MSDKKIGKFVPSVLSIMSDETDLAPPGTTDIPLLSAAAHVLNEKPSDDSPKIQTSQKGVENAKKRLRAFSIQKKMPITPPTALTKSSGAMTVVIGKLAGVKPPTKPPEGDSDTKIKLPKPPKPGSIKRGIPDSYNDFQKKTLSEIEDMKRKMELVELGIPLGLICPAANSDKAMPTKAMPPIKTFLGPAQIDEIIREAKKCKAEGKEYKFDYNKVLPDYDNPFQRKKEEPKSSENERDRYSERKSDRHNKYVKHDSKSDKDRDRKRFDKSQDSRRHSDIKKDSKFSHKSDKDIYKGKEKLKLTAAALAKTETPSEKSQDKDQKDTDLNLNDYLVCDSWSLDTEDKNSSSPNIAEGKVKQITKKEAKLTPITIKKIELPKVNSSASSPSVKVEPIEKLERLQPVKDSFKYEIDDDEPVDIFSEICDIGKYSKPTVKKLESPSSKLYEPYDSVDISQSSSTEEFAQKFTDDTFLESVINEIKQEDMSEDDMSQDKGFLVEYDPSPDKISLSTPDKVVKGRGSVTPELDGKSGRRFSESGKSVESGYRSTESFSVTDSIDKELSNDYDTLKMPKATIESLETWNFVLKICQPILFRHDRNKCYRETRSAPKLWFAVNPKLCACVKDRRVVYGELEACKMALVDRVYGCDQISDGPFPKQRTWYPKENHCLIENPSIPISTAWQIEEISQSSVSTRTKETKKSKENQEHTPRCQNDEMALDREYQRFMDAVWPEVAEVRSQESRSNTPLRSEGMKETKAPEDCGMLEDEVKRKKKLEKVSSEGWSQESDVEDQEEIKSAKKSKNRKRKHESSSDSSDSSDSDDDSARKVKKAKKKNSKKLKSKMEKRRRLEKKRTKKLKEKARKKGKKLKEMYTDDDDVLETPKGKKHKKSKPSAKKKEQKKRKPKKSSSSSSSSSSSESSGDEAERARRKRARKEKRRDAERRKRRKSSSESAESDDVFDVNILNNIKTERLTDEENKKTDLQEFSPRRQPILPRPEIINVKELQNSLVGIKQEVVEPQPVPPVRMDASDDVVDAKSASDAVKEPEDCVVETHHIDFKDLPELEIPLPKSLAEESNLSQTSSQESVCSVKESYEKDNSHLRPSSQNSNYSFNDVMKTSQSQYFQKLSGSDLGDMEGKFHDEYECRQSYDAFDTGYEFHESQKEGRSRRIETVVSAGARGEIKCDWRAPAASPAPAPPAAAAPRPRPRSRWGLKPGEANIVLTGAPEPAAEPPQVFPIRSVLDAAPDTYRIQTISSSRGDDSMSPVTGYDEAYADMYGALDRLQYGDCFAQDLDLELGAPGMGDGAPRPGEEHAADVRMSLDARIDRVLRDTVMSEPNESGAEQDMSRERGILLNKEEKIGARASKRVSFADGYKPGQDSDVEQPPKKRRAWARARAGCAWPCPAAHADHVPLWDALPPPPPPPGSPPPAPAPAPPLALLRPRRRARALHAPPRRLKYDSIPMPALLTTEPPPSLLGFQ